ncbi:hypothetical protein BXZ70DRAFT_1004403 [Cristinia sonorae]|uniref:RlpA-like protein double-psi beta-barrel domain-containing protein n=1 Tax=Cristinia sonorae TaxID=1940300 RepID=A0A8K0UXN9_9AGAR|nr:hypothetical protein BXZ70DRAFT_1004403 [Cristinia sonorae]
MHALKPSSILVSAFFVSVYMLVTVTASDLRAMDTLESRYARAHSLGNNYHFSTRDGWQTVNITNLQYKYRRDLIKDDSVDDDDLTGNIYSQENDDLDTLSKRTGKNATFNPPSKSKGKSSSKTKSQSKAAPASKGSKKDSSKSSSKSANKSSKSSKKLKKTSANSLTSSVKSILASLKPKGKAEPVTITWYTGHDLENPSCWPNPIWAPSDASFACALTLEGWTTRPSCFKFLELCNTPKKCVFVRVVDSCAGCKKGSKHVDLTQAAFKELASLDEGLLQVQMRQATEPDGWLENLWGPKA